jgi:uncharacterized membrane protein AbrB (regulator of aidB expression)
MGEGADDYHPSGGRATMVLVVARAIMSTGWDGPNRGDTEMSEQKGNLRFVAVAWTTGYLLMFLAQIIRGIDRSFLRFTSPAVLVLITTVILLNIRKLYSSYLNLWYVSLLYVSLLPMARESTHYDPVQVPMTLFTLLMSVVFFGVGVGRRITMNREENRSPDGGDS